MCAPRWWSLSQLGSVNVKSAGGPHVSSSTQSSYGSTPYPTHRHLIGVRGGGPVCSAFTLDKLRCHWHKAMSWTCRAPKNVAVQPRAKRPQSWLFESQLPSYPSSRYSILFSFDPQNSVGSRLPVRLLEPHLEAFRDVCLRCVRIDRCSAPHKLSGTALTAPFSCRWI